MAAMRTQVSSLLREVMVILRSGFEKRRFGKLTRVEIPARFRNPREFTRKIQRSFSCWARSLINRLVGFFKKCIVRFWSRTKLFWKQVYLFASQLILTVGLARVLVHKCDINIEIALGISISFQILYWRARGVLAQ